MRSSLQLAGETTGNAIINVEHFSKSSPGRFISGTQFRGEAKDDYPKFHFIIPYFLLGWARGAFKKRRKKGGKAELFRN